MLLDVYSKCNKHAFLFGSILISLISLSTLYSNYIFLAIIAVSFLSGAVACHLLIRSKKFPLIDIPYLKEWKRKPFEGLRHCRRCAVCGNRKCKRHKPELSIQVLKPWTNLLVSEDIDIVLDEIFTLTFQEYILSWYNDLISIDEAFLEELKLSIRYLLATLIKRVQQVDLVSLITGPLIKTLLEHADAHSKAVKISGGNADFMKQLPLHTSLKSRTTELEYLHSLTQCILPFLLPGNSLKSRTTLSLVQEVFCGSVLLPAMDIIANPDIINELLIIFFDKTPMTIYPESELPKVELLSNFEIGNGPASHSVLQTDLQTILSHQELLFPFMQFLKDEAAVNVLQFCLGVDDFNKRILNPDLTINQLISLHKEIDEMYKTYFAFGSVDRINFEPSILEEMKAVVEGDPTNVIILNTTTTLCRSYDFAYSQLENIYCPLFHQSSRYFSLLCGDRLNSGGNKSLWRNKKEPEQSTMSKIGSKLKGVFVTNIDNGRMYEEESGLELGVGLYVDGTADDLFQDGDPSSMKDLSAWRVSIPRVETLMDLNCKYYNAFVIEVQRIDVRDQEPEDVHWTVQRRYNEFYVLAAKLAEFHGESSTFSLPPKRSFSNKSPQFLESRRPIFEKYITELLSMPSLRGSELLYKFLKSPVEFQTNFLPELNLGKMIKTVPMKLLKEKGQHLLPFLQNFVTSTEAAKPKPSKIDWKDIYELPKPPFMEKLTKSLYEDNLNANFPNTNRTCPTVNLGSIYHYLMYLCAYTFKLPKWNLRVLLTFEFPLKEIIQSYVESYLDTKLKQALHPKRLVALLENLRDVLFFDEDRTRSQEEKDLRKEEALKSAKDFFPNWLVAYVGSKKYSQGLEQLFMILQNPRLNKQLSYRLLDLLALELFPELKDDTPTPP